MYATASGPRASGGSARAHGADPFERAVARVEARERIERRVRAVAALQLALGAVALALAGLTGGLLVALGAAAPGSVGAALLGALGAAVGGFGALLSAPALLGGIGLLRRRPWARRLVTLLAALELLWFPVGTALGAATLVVLLPEETRRYFA